jgi:anti-anti-sigma regulatory factor
MNGKLEFSPFVIRSSDSQVTFRFNPNSLEHGYEYPANLETLLHELVKKNAEMFGDREVLIDLEELPAISSKQLGAMLAVRKTCAPDRKVRVMRLRPNVSELLRVTKLEDFFDWS